MRNENERKEETPDSRRQFLRRGVIGASWFGLGGALGLWAPVSQAQSPPKKSGTGKLGPEYTYDVEKLKRTDPKLLLYAEGTPLNPGLKEIRAIEIGPDGKIYVAGDRQIAVLNEQGQRVGGMDLPEPPRCLALGAEGKLYIGLKNRVAVWRNGSEQARWDEIGGKALVTAIAAAEQDVFVADAGNRAVWRYDLAGKKVGRIGLKEGSRTSSRFVVPSPYFDLTLGPGNLLWVANAGQHRLEAFTFDGDLESSWGESSDKIDGFCGCCNPAYFAIASDGRFITSEKGLTRVKVYSPKGEFEGVVAGTEQFPKHGTNPNSMSVGVGVAADAQGRVLVADTLAGQVRIFTRKTAS